jgi:outer membrane protein assembly factor BamB
MKRILDIMNRVLILALGCLVVPSMIQAQEAANDRLDNWPHWRGPLANGSAPRGNPPIKWDEKTHVKWKTEIPGSGTSTPIVWGDRVFVLTAVDTGKQAAAGDLPKQDGTLKKMTKPPTTYHQFIVVCLDRVTGQVRWKQIACEKVPHEGHHDTHNYAAGSPATDGKHLYVSFGSFGIYCYDLDGKLQWQRDLGRMETRLGWGEASTPALHRDTLMVNWDNEAKSFLTALDARTGQTRWKVNRDEVTTWATPLVVDYRGQTQAIISATKRVRSYDLATGKVLWECGGQTVNVIPSPVLFGERVICMSGYKGSTALSIPLDAQGDITDSEKVAWRFDRGTPYVPSPLLDGNRLYFTLRNEAVMTCLDALTGKALVDQKRLPGLSNLYSSPVAAAGRIYLADRNGTTLVFKANDQFEVLAVNRLGEAIDASPAIVGKQLFLRGEKYLWCLEE